jgi:hypothetical protein
MVRVMLTRGPTFWDELFWTIFGSPPLFIRTPAYSLMEEGRVIYLSHQRRKELCIIEQVNRNSLKVRRYTLWDRFVDFCDNHQI